MYMQWHKYIMEKSIQIVIFKMFAVQKMNPFHRKLKKKMHLKVELYIYFEFIVDKNC